MKRFNTIAVYLAGGLALTASLRAETAPATGNPYASVVARNIFGLNPPVLVDPPPPPVEPPVKIMLNGIMDVFGQVKALYKVAGKTPGKEDSYMLTEGQGNDGIEVVKIDQKKGEVTFNNHGVEQVVPLAAAAASSLPAVAAPAGSTGIPGIPNAVTSGTPFGSSGFTTAFGGRGAPAVSTPAAANAGANAAANAANVRTVPTRVGFHSDQPPVNPAAQALMIEVQREQYKNTGDPTAMILPPTDLTPSEDSGKGIPAPSR